MSLQAIAKNPPKNKDTPTYNSNNFEDTANSLTIEYGDNRFFNKLTGGYLGSELRLNPNTGSASLTINSGDLKISDSTQGLYLRNRYRIKDTYLASSSFKLGKDSQFLMEYDKINLLSSGANGILNYGSKHTMDIKNGKMSINSTTITDNNLDVNGNMSVNGVVNCTSVICPTFNPFITGSIALFPSTAIPSGWLLCDGTSYSKVAYQPLYDAIQYTFGGSGDNFNVPNFTDRFPLGTFSQFINNKGGSSTATLNENNLPSHTHPYIVFSADGYFRRTSSSTVKYYFWASTLQTYTFYFTIDPQYITPSQSYSTEADALAMVVPSSFTGGKPIHELERYIVYPPGAFGGTSRILIVKFVYTGDVSNTDSFGSGNPFSIQNPYIKYCYIIKT